jgi:hypothetical protein
MFKKMLIAMVLIVELFANACYLKEVKNNHIDYHLHYVCIDGKKFILIEGLRRVGLSNVGGNCTCPKKDKSFWNKIFR